MLDDRKDIKNKLVFYSAEKFYEENFQEKNLGKIGSQGVGKGLWTLK